MTTAIRYYSKFGHTAMMAKTAGELTQTVPQTVDVPLSEPVDTLYLGGGVFLGRVDSSIGAFVKTLSPDKVKRVVCFGSCAILKSPVPQLRQMLEAQGIAVAEQEFACRGSMGPLHKGHPNQEDLDSFREFIKSTIR